MISVFISCGFGVVPKFLLLLVFAARLSRRRSQQEGSLRSPQIILDVLRWQAVFANPLSLGPLVSFPA